MKRFWYLASTISVLGLALVAAGCPAQQGTSTSKEKTTTTALETTTTGGATSEPKVEFVEPKEGAEVTGPDVKAEIKVENFNLVNKLSQPNVEGEGHIHWFVDDGPNYAAANPDRTFTATGLKAGEHSIRAELHQNSHEPLDPAAQATVKFIVK